MILVTLPAHLCELARVDGDVAVEVHGPATLGAVIDALEAGYPALRGTIRDPFTRQRRRLVRFFACGEDLSHEPLDTLLPDPVSQGIEPLMIVGAIAGG